MKRKDAFRKLHTICDRLDTLGVDVLTVTPLRLYLFGSVPPLPHPTIPATLTLRPAAPVAASAIQPETAATARAILMQTMAVAGFQYYDGEAVWSQLALGDTLELRREAANQYDEFAIEVYWQGRKLGYLPRGDNETIAAMMDRGEQFFGRLSRRRGSKNPWERLEVEVWLTA